MMKRNLSIFISSFLILIVLVGRYLADYAAFKNGVRLLLPVWIESVESNAFSSLARIRYYNFIPIEELVQEKGTIVVERFNNGQVAFAAKSVGQRLRPREVRLKYTITPSSLASSQFQGPNIHFASSELRFFNQKSLTLSDYYAVVYVNDDGEAFLAGITDHDGTQLIKGLAFSAFHIY